jgi:thiamine transport system permease protein
VADGDLALSPRVALATRPAAHAPHPGWLAAGCVVLLVAAALAGLVQAGGGAVKLADLAEPYLWRTVRGAAVQALLSTALSLTLGTALALALLRRTRFPGRALLMALIAAASVTPTIVIVFGVVAVWGASGWIAALARPLGLDLPAIYGLHGIVLAHVAMNAPLVARVMLAAFAQQPPEQARLAELLRFTPWQSFRHLDGPVIRREWPGLAAFVFLMCFTSFAVVLALGGGPRHATLEVAIYQALRLDVDFARAASLALLQMLLCVGFVLGFGLLGAKLPDGAGQIAPRRRPDASRRAVRAVDAAMLLLCALLIGPIIVSVLGGAAALPALLTAELGRAFLTSVVIAGLAAMIAVALALMLAALAASTRQGRVDPVRQRMVDALALLALGLPPFALVTGLFALSRSFGPLQGAGLASAGLVLVPVVNALMALPFVYRLLAPPLAASARRHGRLSESLGLTGVNRLRHVAWPALRRPLVAALALAAALSLGDFGVIALFGGGDLVTLPYLLAERMGSYRQAEAAGIALVLVALAFALALVADRA